mgnify:CR=1 FL=1
MPQHLAIDRARSAARIARDIETLSRAPYTAGGVGITRYAFTEPFANTLRFLSDTLVGLGFHARLDAVGNLVATNRPPGAPTVAVGSHCDSVRAGGRFDGALGMSAALEIARSAFNTTGQRCTCTRRLILHEAIAGRFLSAFSKAAF